MARLLEDCYQVMNPETGEIIYEARYCCTNGYNTAIVATMTEGVDWAAYLGACSGWDYPYEVEAILQAAEFGAKLSEADARYYFDVDLPYRH